MINENEQSSVNWSAGIPLFYLGDDHTFRPLARRLSTEHEFRSLGIELPSIDQVKNPYSLRGIAQHFANRIRERQTRGPYMLGGWCAHGLLALETAQQLREHGQGVALLVLLETINPERLRQQRRWIRGIVRLQADGNRLNRKSKKIDWSRSTPLEILSAAAANYLPRPYDGPVLLMRGRDSLFGFDSDGRLGWGKTLGQDLEICETRGNRGTTTAEPNVKRLAEKVSAHLKKV